MHYVGRVDGKLTTCSVPIHDGQEQFQLGKYWETPSMGVVTKGSMVILFTVRKGALPKGMEEVEGMLDTVKCVTYLNVSRQSEIDDPERFQLSGSSCGVSTSHRRTLESRRRTELCL